MVVVYYVEILGVVVLVVYDVMMWWVGDDVVYFEFGYGWVQGVGYGVVIVWFEMCGLGLGLVWMFFVDIGDISNVSLFDSLDWLDYIGQLLVEGFVGVLVLMVDDVGDW